MWCPRKALKLVFEEERVPASGGESDLWFSMPSGNCGELFECFTQLIALVLLAVNSFFSPHSGCEWWVFPSSCNQRGRSCFGEQIRDPKLDSNQEGERVCNERVKQKGTGSAAGFPCATANHGCLQFPFLKVAALALGSMGGVIRLSAFKLL